MPAALAEPGETIYALGFPAVSDQVTVNYTANVDTVSYTHLDVYKRQVSMWVATRTSKPGNSRWASSRPRALASWGVKLSDSEKDWTKW